MKKPGKKTLARCWRTAGVYHTVFTEKVAKLLYDLAPDCLELEQRALSGFPRREEEVLR